VNIAAPMGAVAGIVAAVLSFLLGRIAGFDRDRAFYPTLLIVVASYYVLFAAMGGSARTLAAESAVMGVFSAAAIVGFRWRLWVAAAGLVAHGLFDMLVHGQVIVNTGMPAWWPAFCAAYDVAAGAFLAWLLVKKK
jgi:hypothetical protein